MGVRWHIIASAGSTLAVWAVVCSASAQSASPYTMPLNTPTESHEGPEGPARVEAPHPLDTGSPDEISAPAPQIPVDQGNPLQQMVKERKSWVEMTPEEILGIAPAKKPAVSKSDDPNARDSGQSPLRDFLRDQRRPADGTANRDEAGDDTSFWSHGSLVSERQRSGAMRDGSRPGSLFSHLLEGERDSISHQYSDSDWTSVFATPTAAPPSTEQQAEMAAFRQLLNPSEDGKNSSPEARSAASLPATDPNVEPVSTKYNPDGSSFTPLDAAIGRPKKLEALPTVTGPGNYQTPLTPPSWAPQPPPWKLTTPQLFVEPQRHF